MITERVDLGERSYDVVIGDGARHELSAVLPSRARRVAVVTQGDIPVEVDTGRETERFEIGGGEDHKNLTTVEELCSRLRARPGVLGVRLTGAGFGGCVVAVTEPGALEVGWTVRPGRGAQVTSG